MSDLDQHLINEFQDAEYRYAYAESFLNTKLATQIKTLREQRGKTQAEVGALIGISQPGYRRFEDVNHDVWKTDSLWNIARAYGVRVNISFETFGSLLEEKKHFNKEALKRPDFEHDPAFEEQSEPEKAAAEAARIEKLQRVADAFWYPLVAAKSLDQDLWADHMTLQRMAGRSISNSLIQPSAGSIVNSDKIRSITSSPIYAANRKNVMTDTFRYGEKTSTTYRTEGART